MHKYKGFLSSAFAIVMLWFFAGGCGDSEKITPVEFKLDAFREPPVSVRPWARWWWPGNDVDDEELRREVSVLVDAFFGGAEIQAFNAALNPYASEEELARRFSVDTQEYFDHLAVVMEEARSKGLAIDLTLGSGWPTGGMQVKPEESLRTLLWSERQVQGPGSVTLQFDEPDKPAFYTLHEAFASGGEQLTRYLPEFAEIAAVVAARVTGGERTTGLLDLSDQIELDRSSIQVLTDQVSADRKLIWNVPDRTWQVIVFFRAPDGGYPIFNAQHEAGFVADHFDASQVINNLEYLQGDRTNLQAYYGSPLRGLFIDSFEFKVERFFSTDFLSEFLKRRGYDITPFLAAVLLPGADNSLFDGINVPRASAFRFDEQDHRLQYDYQLTASDLFIERFAETTRKWAEEHGMLSRMQAYGLNIDVIRSSGRASIPEAEQAYAGGLDMFLKIVSSGAHLYERNLVSAESLVWMLRDHMTTPTVVKAAVNKLFSAGINHLVYHGFPYRKLEGYGETGWHAFSSPYSGYGTYSSNISETNPYWSDMDEVNRYVARCQFALRAGRPEADLLVYYPWFGFPAAFFRLEDYWEPLFNGRLNEDDKIAGWNPLLGLATQLFGKPDHGARGEWLMQVREKLEALHANGYSWDWVNEHSLIEAAFEGDRITIRGQQYKALLLIKTQEMAPGLVSHLADLSTTGAPIIVVGTPPVRQPGFFDFEKGDKKVVEEMNRLFEGKRARCIKDESVLPSDLLPDAGIKPGVRFESTATSVHHVRRRLGNDAQLIFFSNTLRDPLETSFSVTGGCKPGQWLDPNTGEVYKLQDGRMHLRLDAFDARVLTCGVRVDSSAKEEEPLKVASVVPIMEWTLDVHADDITGQSVMLKLDDLVDWSEITELRYSAGPGIYHAQVDLPTPEPDQRIILDLGHVEGTAEVFLNDQIAGRLLVPAFDIDVTRFVHSGKNEVAVHVTTPLRNRLIGKHLAGDPEYAQFAEKEDTLAPAGMLGPVELKIGH